MNIHVITIDTGIQAFLNQQFLIFAIGTTAIGFMVLLFVIRTIDSAARQIPLPKIEVYFEKYLRGIKAPAKSKNLICINSKNNGEDVAEDVWVFVHFPPDFRIEEENEQYEIHPQLDMGADYPDYNSVKFDMPLMHLDVFYGWEIDIEMPTKIGRYVIPVYIHEKKTGLTKTELTIDVTS